LVRKSRRKHARARRYSSHYFPSIPAQYVASPRL
jgi:hypothetical protein